MNKLLDTWTVFTSYFRYRPSRRFHSRKQLKAWQHRQVTRHLAKILPRSPFYRRWYASVLSRKKSLENWREFPLIDKRIMMENFSDLNTARIDREHAFAVATQAERSRDFSPEIAGISVGLSSGTSGHRGIFLVSREERMRYAGALLAKSIPDSILKRHRMALFLRANSNVYSSVTEGRLQFAYFDLLEPIASMVDRLNRFQPTLLFAPPSVLRKLGAFIESGQLRIRPDRIFSVAETLDPLDQMWIEKIFQKKIHQVYQATEGFLGISCSHGTLHLNEDMVAIEKEFIDAEKTKFVPIITDFSRCTQPVLRYRLNDILTLKKDPCPCGSVFTALEFIEGRCDDLVYFESDVPQAPKWVTVFPDFLRRCVLLVPGAIEEYRIEQSLPGELRISLRLTDESQRQKIVDRIDAEIALLASRLQCRKPKVTFDSESSGMERLGTRKLRRVERLFAELSS